MVCDISDYINTMDLVWDFTTYLLTTVREETDVYRLDVRQGSPYMLPGHKLDWWWGFPPWGRPRRAPRG